MRSPRLPGRSIRALGLLVLVAALVPGSAPGQVPFDQENPSRMRERTANKPQTSQKLDDGVRKLNSDDLNSRLEGLRTLAELEGEARAVEYMMQAASDPDQRIRIKAIDILGNVHAKDATPFLVQQLFLKGTDPLSKQHILAALGKIEDRRATQPILDFLARDGDPAIRANAIFALGDIGDPAALEPLRALARNGREEALRGVAEEAVRKIEHRPAPEVVPPALAVDRRPGREAPTP